MKLLIFITTLLFAVSCQDNTTNDKQASQPADPCLNLPDTFTTLSVFSNADTALAQKDFDEAVKFIESKGTLRQAADKNNNKKAGHWKDIILPHYIDTCNNKHITQLFMLKNVTANSCYFKSMTPLKSNKDYYPRFYFAQWNFANNADRDSALKVMQWVYTHGGTEYEYRYNQTVIGDKRLYLIEPGAKIFEATGIEYAKWLEEYMQSN